MFLINIWIDIVGTIITMNYRWIIKYQVKTNVSTWAMGRKQRACPKIYAYTTLQLCIQKCSPKSKVKLKATYKFTVHVLHTTKWSSTCRELWPLEMQKSKLYNIYCTSRLPLVCQYTISERSITSVPSMLSIQRIKAQPVGSTDPGGCKVKAW